jgi:hypothetical protein
MLDISLIELIKSFEKMKEKLKPYGLRALIFIPAIILKQAYFGVENPAYSAAFVLVPFVIGYNVSMKASKPKSYFIHLGVTLLIVCLQVYGSGNGFFGT